MNVREKKARQEFATLVWCIVAMLIAEKFF